ncbi:unnamed protein product [Arctogadus glacialis]
MEMYVKKLSYVSYIWREARDIKSSQLFHAEAVTLQGNFQAAAKVRERMSLGHLPYESHLWDLTTTI